MVVVDSVGYPTWSVAVYLLIVIVVVLLSLLSGTTKIQLEGHHAV